MLSRYQERKEKKMLSQQQQKEIKKKRYLEIREERKKMERENEYLKRKQNNLKILKEFLSADERFKRNLIFRDEWLKMKKEEGEIPELGELMKFVEFLMQAFFFEKHEYENKKITLEMFGEKSAAVSKYLGNLPNATIKLDWDSINLKEAKDIFLFIFTFQCDTEPKNLSSNDIFEELFACKKFIIWVIFRYPNFENSDCNIYSLFKKDLRKLALKLYKKCYYFKTPKGTKPKPSREKKEMEGRKEKKNQKH